MMADDFTRMRDQADDFRQTITRIKSDVGPVDFEWYPSDTLSAFVHLDRLLTGDNRSLFSGKKRILDLGCQDGEISFFLESAGHEVVAVDHPTYNHDGMRGIRALKEALGSSVQLCDVDLDRQFRLPDGTYDVAVVLGVLYHLRNPFYVLDELARRASYCLLSTRIARRFPDGTPVPPGLPIAYLLDERELNDDETNYFIFSEYGLRTLLARTYWDLCDYMSVGGTLDSDPIRPDRDERFFCLLKSRYGRLANVEFLDGWHQPEESGWRWTEREFSARVHWDGSGPPRIIIVETFISEQLIGCHNALRLSLSLNGRQLAPEVYRSCGSKKLIRKLRGVTAGEFFLEFSLSGALPADDSDPRERGIIVTAIRAE
jgi:SAM-dependent methyltransferase